MGCAASIVLLQAFRSVVQRNCPHICRRRRREELSHEILPLDSDEEMSRPRTLIIMVRYAGWAGRRTVAGVGGLFFSFNYVFVQSIDRQFVTGG